MNGMDCAAARELMLEAEMAELNGIVRVRGRGTVETPLSHHIAGCAECSEIAKQLLQGYRDLDQGLAALVPARGQNVVRFGKRRLAWAAVPLAVAAIMTLLLVRGDDGPAPPPPTVLAQLMFPEEAVVTPPPGKQAVIMEKPGLTVVWLY